MNKTHINNHYLHLVFSLLLTVGLLSACGSPATSDAQNSFLAGEPTDIQVLIGANDFPVGRPRVPILLFAGPERVDDAKTVVVTVFDLNKNPPEAKWSGQATNYSDYAIPYWVVYPELPSPGTWGLIAQIGKADGQETSAQLIIQANDDTLVPLIGRQPPASQSRTIASEPDMRKLTSAAQPNLAFYQLTIAEAMQNGKPTVVVFATPGFCETAMCSPVLGSAEEVQATYGEQANFIHVEVFKEYPPNVVVDETMVEWNLISEPWTFVLNRQGIVLARLNGPVSPRELTEWLEVALK